MCKEMMKTEFFKMKGVITKIHEKVTIKRKDSPDFTKRVITLETIDGQILYPELRNRRLNLLDGVYENSTVEIEFSFRGSEKNGKRYNNIYINNLKRL